MQTLESDIMDITAAGRKIKRQQREINLLRQVVKAYDDAIESAGDPAAWVALGSAKAALKHHDDNTETGRRLEEHLERIGQLPDYDYEAVERG